MVFCTAVTRPASLPFLDARVNLLNVAVSRAREHLIIIGAPELLKQGQRTRLLLPDAAPLVPSDWQGQDTQSEHS